MQNFHVYFRFLTGSKIFEIIIRRRVNFCFPGCKHLWMEIYIYISICMHKVYYVISKIVIFENIYFI